MTVYAITDTTDTKKRRTGIAPTYLQTTKNGTTIIRKSEYGFLLLRGGATVLKVGGDNFASGASQKIFLTPHFLASGGTKYCCYFAVHRPPVRK